MIQEQGSFTAGGKVLSEPGAFDSYNPTEEPAGQTYHGEHLYTFSQVPANARCLPFGYEYRKVLQISRYPDSSLLEDSSKPLR